LADGTVVFTKAIFTEVYVTHYTLRAQKIYSIVGCGVIALAACVGIVGASQAIIDVAFEALCPVIDEGVLGFTCFAGC
jgi:hypothetical protein